jgi:hypothetical protein
MLCMMTNISKQSVAMICNYCSQMHGSSQLIPMPPAPSTLQVCSGAQNNKAPRPAPAAAVRRAGSQGAVRRARSHRVRAFAKSHVTIGTRVQTAISCGRWTCRRWLRAQQLSSLRAPSQPAQAPLPSPPRLIGACSPAVEAVPKVVPLMLEASLCKCSGFPGLWARLTLSLRNEPVMHLTERFH